MSSRQRKERKAWSQNFFNNVGTQTAAAAYAKARISSSFRLEPNLGLLYFSYLFYESPIMYMSLRSGFIALANRT